MKNILKIMVLGSLLLFIGTEAEAGRRDVRQARQHGRIQQGVQSGELTKGEAHKLRKQQRHVRRVEKRAEADGTVTTAEKYRIEKAQDRASKNIYRKKHNDADRSNAAVTPDANSNPDSAAPESVPAPENQ